MPKQWTLVIHRDYNHSLRHTVADSDRYLLSVAIWEKLVETDDPTVLATPVPDRPGRFIMTIMNYIVPFEVSVDKAGNVRPDAIAIRLLPIAKIG